MGLVSLQGKIDYHRLLLCSRISRWVIAPEVIRLPYHVVGHGRRGRRVQVTVR